jgi:hypothetical protein
MVASPVRIDDGVEALSIVKQVIYGVRPNVLYTRRDKLLKHDQAHFGPRFVVLVFASSKMRRTSKRPLKSTLNQGYPLVASHLGPRAKNEAYEAKSIKLTPEPVQNWGYRAGRK